MKNEMFALTKKTKAILIIVITFSYIIIAGIYGIYEMGPTEFRMNWIGGTTKYGTAGESVHFNFSVEVRGGRIVMHFEIRDLQSEWETLVNTDKIDVNPGETGILSIQVNIPLDAEIGDTNEILFNMTGGEKIHGYIVEQTQNPYQTLYLRVGEEPVANETNNNEEWNDRSWWGPVYHFDVWGLVIHLYLIVFVQTIIFYIIPELKKFKTKRE